MGDKATPMIMSITWHNPTSYYLGSWKKDVECNLVEYSKRQDSRSDNIGTRKTKPL